MKLATIRTETGTAAVRVDAGAVRQATPEQAAAAIAGYTVVNDVTARDFQYRSVEWLQGKTFERSTPVGPWLVIVTPVPGDLIATGTPGGAGHARKPPHYLAEGSRLVTRVERVGELRNTMIEES